MKRHLTLFRHAPARPPRSTGAVTHEPASGPKFPAVLPAALLLIAGLSGLFLASLAGASKSGTYVVVAAPGSTLADTINLVRAADGRLVQVGRFTNIVIAGSTRPDFPTALRHAGAWAAIAAPARGGCLDPLLADEAS